MTYIVAVRALCEFAAKTGDLDQRFTPAPTGLQGIAGHATVTGRRHDHYESEVLLEGEYKTLRVRGRADGFDPHRNRLEEIKTYRGDLARMPAHHRALHWAQLKVYGHLFCTARGLDSVDLGLVHFNIGSQKETVLTETATAVSLAAHFNQLCERFIDWANQELAHGIARTANLAELRFPHAAFRTGQRELAETIYKSASVGRCLMAQAPTGIGKTLGTLFPLLKALSTDKLDRIFFLAAKTPGRVLAMHTLDALRKTDETHFGVRVLEFVARDKACEYKDKACHGESCPLARGFYDRLPAARAAALRIRFLDQEAVRATALAHQVCPYYLSQELARWCDIVVGDYNYYFDANALLHGLTITYEWRVGVLVDEAHNLIERARAMYTATLEPSTLAGLQTDAPPPIKKALTKIRKAWHAVAASQTIDYQAYVDLPTEFIQTLQLAVATIAEYLADNPHYTDTRLLEFYFDAINFCRLGESFGDHSIFDVTKTSSLTRKRNYAATLCIRNIIPAPFLKSRFDNAHTAILFSATLSPTFFYKDLLGLPTNTTCVDIESPFHHDQLSIHVADKISTRYKDRNASLPAVVDLMGVAFSRRRGNYLAFFSSFDYLDAAASLLAKRFPSIPTWRQSRRMDEPARREFLDRFGPDGCGIGFAVLGGAFGEGIDLPGDRLIGAFIATLGMPQINAVNEAVKARMQQLFGCGYDYAYLFPGIQKVVQAAGRVIRTLDDRGEVHLMDDRFEQPRIQALMPAWWKMENNPVDHNVDHNATGSIARENA